MNAFKVRFARAINFEFFPSSRHAILTTRVPAKARSFYFYALFYILHSEDLLIRNFNIYFVYKTQKLGFKRINRCRDKFWSFRPCLYGEKLAKTWPGDPRYPSPRANRGELSFPTIAYKQSSGSFARETENLARGVGSLGCQDRVTLGGRGGANFFSCKRFQASQLTQPGQVASRRACAR